MKTSTAALSILLAAGVALTACMTGEEFDTSATTTAASEAASTADGSSSAEADTATTGDTITVEDNTGTKVVPADPQTIVALDNRTFELLDSWGVKLAAAPVQLIPSTVSNYKNDDSIVDIGNHREPDLEALTAVKPDLIISGQRFASFDEEIEKLNPDTPLIELEPRDGEPLDAELKRQVETLGMIFNKQEEAKETIATFDKALERAKSAYNGSDTVMAVNVSGGTIGYIAPSVGRTFGPLFDLLGLKPALEVAEGSSNHKGDDISVEAIADSNPDWMFVLDRDAAISSNDGESVPAESVISDSAALQNTTAISEDHVYYAPSDTYTNESIQTYTEILNGIADAFEAAN